MDDDLIRRIAEGDNEAFRLTYEQAAPAVYGFALSITKNPHDAEDVLQDTFLSIHRNASSYVPRQKPMAWILTIAKNRALMGLRESKRAVNAGDDMEQRADPFCHIENSDDRLTLQAALSILTDDELRIVMLSSETGLKNREIAELLKLPLGTVLSKRKRAMDKLKAYLKQEDN